jgi:hypothetical protein
MDTYEAMYGGRESEDRQNEVVDLLGTIAQILKDKNFNNIIQTNVSGNPLNFDNLRMVEHD